jgi:ankyrin repeat protein
MADINEELLRYIKQNNIDKIVELLNKDANLNYGDGIPLWCAVKFSSYDVVKLLIDVGANVNVMHGYLICEASERNNHEIMELLIKEGIHYNDQYDILIEQCINRDDIHSLKLFIEHDIVKITTNELRYHRVDDYLLFFEECINTRAKNMLEFIIINYPHIISNNAGSLIEQTDIKKYNFMKMLVERNLIDIAD